MSKEQINEKELYKEGNYKIDFSWITFLPIIFVLGVIPLITRFSPVQADQYVYSVLGQEVISDFFSKYKAIMIMMSAAIMIFILFLVFDKNKIKKSKTMNAYYILTGVFALMTILSTVMSEYKNVALWGMPDRSEGMFVILSYLVLMLYTIYAMNKTDDYKYILRPLAVLVVLVGILGFFQFIGKDLLLGTELGKKIVIPEKYVELRGSLQGLMGNMVYGTMFNPNYVGSFAALMIPLFGSLAYFAPGKKRKIAYLFITLISLFLLIGSESSAGIVGVTSAFLLFIVIFAKRLLKNYKILVPVVLVIGIGIVGINFATQGVLFREIGKIVSQAGNLFTGVDETFDYKDAIPVRGITFDKNQIHFELQDEVLTAHIDGDNVSFADRAGGKVDFILDGERYITEDSRFSMLGFKGQIIQREDKYYGKYLGLQVNGSNILLIRIDQEIPFVANPFTLEKEELVEAPAIGFKGKERLGSGRGYIWSRTFPMLKENILWGSGPDTYMLEFPHGDLFARWYSLRDPSIKVDKPHNLYLQIGVNEGVVAMISFISLCLIYIIQSIRLYAFKGSYYYREYIAVAICLAVVGYLGAGMFNDSVVSVAPVFWVLLGAGIAINTVIARDSKSLAE